MNKKKCYYCKDSVNKLLYTFGKYVCKKCRNEHKTGKKGNSGMIYNKNILPSNYPKLYYGNDLSLVRVKKNHKLFCKWFFEHYPKSKGIVGRQLNYLIYYKSLPIGIIGFASPPLNYKKFNGYFNFSENQKHSENSKLILNNNVYRIVDNLNIKNLATKVLKMAREIIFKDYYNKYGNTLKGIITFVEPPRTGALYKADNWDYIGITEGIEVKRRGENWENKQYSKGMQKHIFGYKYKKKFIRKNLNNRIR